MTHHRFSHAAKEYMRNSSAAMAANDDEISGPLLGDPHDLDRRLADFKILKGHQRQQSSPTESSQQLCPLRLRLRNEIARQDLVPGIQATHGIYRMHERDAAIKRTSEIHGYSRST
jgi:hypothetical protein